MPQFNSIQMTFSLVVNPGHATDGAPFGLVEFIRNCFFVWGPISFYLRFQHVPHVTGHASLANRPSVPTFVEHRNSGFIDIWEQNLFAKSP